MQLHASVGAAGVFTCRSCTLYTLTIGQPQVEPHIGIQNSLQLQGRQLAFFDTVLQAERQSQTAKCTVEQLDGFAPNSDSGSHTELGRSHCPRDDGTAVVVLQGQQPQPQQAAAGHQRQHHSAQLQQQLHLLLLCITALHKKLTCRLCLKRISGGFTLARELVSTTWSGCATPSSTWTG